MLLKIRPIFFALLLILLWDFTGITLELNFYILLFFILPIWGYKRILYYQNNRTSFSIINEVIINIFFIYFLCVFYLTMNPFHFSPPSIRGNFNLNPFHDMIYQFRYRSLNYGLLYAGGNVLLLMPFGFLFPFISAQKLNLFKMTCYGFFISLSIELTQYFFTTIRTGNIDDLILNTFGSLIGYILFLILKMIVKEIKSQS
ncbi:VanZ like protein [Natranaerovirga hydrolytica]|uniref:VanZ like protein n=1 Tax=Natranaerovirga hydrolytica TaxID=680378 RepID=A0A4R1MJ50_9FIRM|nr:VanZ family protein [Natranaerovirga hydrolytica]TCK92788.1 VanZ like protein [Natranaerovirga hydrolytica]